MGKNKIPPGEDCHKIWVDGSHRPPDFAAYAFLIFHAKTHHVIAAERYACKGMTINQMELQAINKALDYPGLKRVVIFSDSAYAIHCLTLWRHSWQRYNWTTPAGEPVKNKDLICEIGEKIDALDSVVFSKVKAHTGEPFNSIVDYLAADLTRRMRDDGNINDGAYPV